jgi:hypothetical protein
MPSLSGDQKFLLARKIEQDCTITRVYREVTGNRTNFTSNGLEEISILGS